MEGELVIVAAVVLGGLAGEGSDACPGCSADDGAFQAAAEECTENGSSGGSDGCAFAGTNASLLVIAIVVAGAVVFTGVAVVVAAAAAVAHAGVVVLATALVVAPAVVLRGGRQNGEGEEQRRHESSAAKFRGSGIEHRFSFVLRSRMPEVAMAGWKSRASRGAAYW